MSWYEALKRPFAFFVFSALVRLVSAQVETPMQDALNDICGGFREVLPIVALLLFILAGAIYAIGQVLGS
ncbi:MAG: hypothetical protein NT157_06590, partial [Candidatus Micrarchaeota archaeon]|nr:hypothetical protein [Candidatus Micrarchaeota archaeon]